MSGHCSSEGVNTVGLEAQGLAYVHVCTLLCIREMQHILCMLMSRRWDGVLRPGHRHRLQKCELVSGDWPWQSPALYFTLRVSELALKRAKHLLQHWSKRGVARCQ